MSSNPGTVAQAGKYFNSYSKLCTAYNEIIGVDIQTQIIRMDTSTANFTTTFVALTWPGEDTRYSE